MKWYNTLQFAAMMLMAAAVPVSMNIGIWAAILLAGCSGVKMVAERHIGNPSLSRHARIALAAPILYWLVVFVSALLSPDRAYGLSLAWLKATLLVFPLCFLLTDTSYLRPTHLRLVFYALLLSCLAVFAYFLVLAIGKLADGNPASAVFNDSFDTRHHTYVAMYVVSALAFVLYELLRHRHSLRPWMRWGLAASTPVLITYVMIVNSRAGLIVLWGVVALAMLDGMRQCWWKSLLITDCLVLCIVGSSALLPGHTNRISQTYSSVTEASKDGSVDGDARIDITRSALHRVAQRPLLGYGTGNYRGSLVEQYDIDDFKDGAQARYNAHNQYMESLLSAGVFGLLALLFFLFSPLGLACVRARSATLATLFATGIVAGNLMVESMLERQMGLLFIGYFMAVMVLVVSGEENKFGGVAKI